jgi:enamine deaminase RidA (YjgF/YER057c/UK114 family)
MILAGRGIREWLCAAFRRRSIMSPLSFALSMQRAWSRRRLLTASGALVVAGTSSSALAQTVLGAGKTPPHLRFLQPDASSKQAGYSHVVEATVPGRILFIAGQMGLDGNGNVVGAPGDFKAQATQAYQNIGAALAAAGGGFEHIVRLTQYLIHLRAHQTLVREVRAKFFNPDLPPPASTMIQVGALTREGALYEVDAVAVLPPA